MGECESLKAAGLFWLCLGEVAAEERSDAALLAWRMEEGDCDPRNAAGRGQPGTSRKQCVPADTSILAQEDPF